MQSLPEEEAAAQTEPLQPVHADCMPSMASPAAQDPARLDACMEATTLSSAGRQQALDGEGEGHGTWAVVASSSSGQQQVAAPPPAHPEFRRGAAAAEHIAALRRKCQEAMATLAAAQQRRLARARGAPLLLEPAAAAMTAASEEQQPRPRQAGEEDGECSTSSSGATTAAPTPERVLGPAGGAYPSTCGDIISFRQLPPAHEWDARGMDARVRRLRTLDLLLLHKQWLQWCGMKLPIATLERQLSPERAAGPVGLELADMYARYLRFTQGAMVLAPDAWQETVYYDLETLTPLSQPPTLAYLQGLCAVIFSDNLPKFLKVRLAFKEAAAKLQAEQAQLQQRRERLERLLVVGAVDGRGTALSDQGSGAAAQSVDGCDTAPDGQTRSAAAQSGPSAEGFAEAAQSGPSAEGFAEAAQSGPSAEGFAEAAQSGPSAEGFAEAAPGAAAAAAAAELADVSARLEDNARRQTQLVCEGVHATHYAIPIEQFTQAKLAMYPVCANGHIVTERRQADAEWVRPRDDDD